MGVMSVLMGIASLFYQDKYEFNEERLCTVIDPRVECSRHCTTGAVGEEHCLLYCKAIVRAHPDDDVGHCLDLPACTHKSSTPRNRTTLEFSEHDSFYEYDIHSNVTCYLNSQTYSASYQIHSAFKSIANFIAIGLGVISLVFLAIFVIGFISTFIHRILPHHLQFKKHHHGDHHHLEEDDNKSFL